MCKSQRNLTGCLVKADMKSYISLETEAIFFSAESFLNRVLARSMSWLISFAWAYLTCEEREPRITKWQISCPHWHSNPGLSAYEANALSVELIELINIGHLKVTAFYLSFLCKFPVQRGRCNNDLSCIFLIKYLYRFAVWLIKTFADCKELLKFITRQIILLNLPCGTGNY